MAELSPEAQAVIDAYVDEAGDDWGYGVAYEAVAAVLTAAADQLPITSPHSSPSQIFYNGSAMAANLLRTWAAELNQSDS